MMKFITSYFRRLNTQIGEKDSSQSGTFQFSRYVWIVRFAWTVIIIVLLAVNKYQVHNSTVDIALNEARANFNKDQALRFWAASHGGVYVPENDRTPPNPYLSHIPERDIETPSGVKLTLMNPAYLIRQMNEEFTELYGVSGHLTSLNPLRPENGPDEWEQTALESFENGVTEVIEISEINGEPYMRLMQPMITQEDCLKCHAFQGYQVGDVRGGIGIALPMAPLIIRENKLITTGLVSLGSLWIIGLAGIAIASRQLQSGIMELDLSEKRFRNLFDQAPVSIWEEDFSAIHSVIKDLKSQGVTDLGVFLEENPAFIDQVMQLIEVKDVNNQTLKLFGAEHKEDLLGSLNKIITPETREILRDEILAIQDGKTFFEGETVNNTLQGEKLNILLTMAIPPEGEKLDRVLVSMMDITERKRAEEELRESETRLKEAERLARLGHWELDLQANILYWSDEIYRIFEVDPTQFGASYESFLDTIHPNDRELVDRTYTESVQSKIPYSIDHRLKFKKGRIKYVHEECETSYDEHGNALRSIGTVQDISERVHSEKQIYNQIRRLKALYDIDQAILGSINLQTTLNVVLDKLLHNLELDAGDILLYQPIMHTLEYVTGYGFKTEAFREITVRIGEGQAGKVALERQITHITDLTLETVRHERAKLIQQEKFKVYFGIPLIAKGELVGVLEVFHRSPLDPSPEWIDFLETLAGQAAIAVDNAQLFEGLQRSNLELIQAYDKTLEGWAKALELKDHETEGHSRRVIEMTMSLAVMMDIEEEKLIHVKRGALLHDIGKMGIPDDILQKEGPLDDQEWEFMKQHPQFAHDLLSEINHLKPALEIPYCHHEKWDGTGYPRGLEGEQIPLAARIFALVDVYDALTSDRPYRNAWPRDKVIKYINDQAGKHFDPKITEVFLNFIDLPPKNLVQM